MAQTLSETEISLHHRLRAAHELTYPHSLEPLVRSVNGAANRTTDLRLIEHLVHDLSDATGAAAATRPAAEASVYIARGTAYRRAGDSSHIVVAQHVAGTDDHLKLVSGCLALARSLDCCCFSAFFVHHPVFQA